MTHLWAGDHTMDLRNPDPDKLNLGIICRALSRQPRFSGLSERPISVGQHTLICAKIAQKMQIERRKKFKTREWDGVWYRRAVFIHDFQEAFVCDLPQPVKMMALGYSPIEARLAAAIDVRWNPLDDERKVKTETETRLLLKACDLLALEGEVYATMDGPGITAFKQFNPEWTGPTKAVADIVEEVLSYKRKKVFIEMILYADEIGII